MHNMTHWRRQVCDLKKWSWWPQKVKVATSMMWSEIERSAFFATLTCKSPAVTQLSSENQTLSECSFPWTVFPWVDHKLKMSQSLSLPPFPPSAALDFDSCSCVWFLLKMSCRFNFFCVTGSNILSAHICWIFKIPRSPAVDSFGYTMYAASVTYAILFLFHKRTTLHLSISMM